MKEFGQLQPQPGLHHLPGPVGISSEVRIAANGRGVKFAVPQDVRKELEPNPGLEQIRM